MKRQNGFSLVEVIVTMAIAAIVLSVGVPSFQSYIQNSRQTTSINELAATLQLARNTAITRRTSVSVCRSSDGATCLTGTGSGDWTLGWMMFTNVDGDSTLDAGTDVLLRVHSPLNGDATFSGNNNVINQVTFNSKGLSLGSTGTILHCDSRGDTHAKALVISAGGQVRQATDDPAAEDGIVDVQGTNVTCPA